MDDFSLPGPLWRSKMDDFSHLGPLEVIPEVENGRFEVKNGRFESLGTT
jgi:hypothetical protein